MVDYKTSSSNQNTAQQPDYTIDPFGALAVAKLLAKQDIGDGLGKVTGDFWRITVTRLAEHAPDDRMALFKKLLNEVPEDVSGAILSAVLRQDPAAMQPDQSFPTDHARTRSVVESNRTDTANAVRFANQHDSSMRFVPQWGWMDYDSQRWKRDRTGLAMRRAKETARSIYKEAQEASDDEEAIGLARWAKSSLSRSRLEATLKLAECELSATADQFDSGDPFLFNVTNGTLDLRTGELLPHRAEDMFTRIACTHFEPDARCDTWLTYLDQVMAGNTTLIDFLQRAAGYTITGMTTEHCLVFLYGNGRNGKSTFTNILEAVCGDYATKLRSESLMLNHQNGGSASGDIAKLSGSRLVIASELKSSRRMDESLVKDLTGGESITARFLFREEFTFQPAFKLWMYGNNQPIIRDTDEGIWSRILTVPFSVFIPPEKRDRDLVMKLRAELPGILAWMVRGCQLWQRDGLNPPNDVKAATNAYRAEMDDLGRFIDECCVIDLKAATTSRSLYEAFCRWNGDSPRDKVPADFGQLLRKRGLKPERIWSGGVRERGWLGIGLRE